MTNECRPPAEFENVEWHWIKPANHAAQQWRWAAGIWISIGEYERTPQVQAAWGYVYLAPCRPDDALARRRLEDVLRRSQAQFQFYADEHAKAGKTEKAATNQRFADLCRRALEGGDE